MSFAQRRGQHGRLHGIDRRHLHVQGHGALQGQRLRQEHFARVRAFQAQAVFLVVGMHGHRIAGAFHPLRFVQQILRGPFIGEQVARAEIGKADRHRVHHRQQHEDDDRRDAGKQITVGIGARRREDKRRQGQQAEENGGQHGLAGNVQHEEQIQTQRHADGQYRRADKLAHDGYL